DLTDDLLLPRPSVARPPRRPTSPHPCDAAPYPLWLPPRRSPGSLVPPDVDDPSEASADGLQVRVRLPCRLPGLPWPVEARSHGMETGAPPAALRLLNSLASVPSLPETAELVLGGGRCFQA